MSDLYSAMVNACRDLGVIPPSALPASGKWVNADLHGDARGKNDARIKIFHDGEGGIIHHWKNDEQRIFFKNGIDRLSPEQRAARQQAIIMARAQADEELRREREAAAEKASKIWADAKPEAEHPYLATKGIKPHGARLHGEALAIPMRADGAICSLQFIAADGSKKFLTGGRVAGCYFSIGSPVGAPAMCIVEGFATGASIHEATGYPVAVAFNAGNLVAVAKTMHAKFSELRLILCADDDHKTEGNPGLTKANEAALSVGGSVAIPDFGADRQDKATDFNDMAALQGMEAVKRAIANARPVEMLAYTQAPNNATGAIVAGQEWPEPQPLPKLPPVPEFPLDLLPNDLVPWIGDAAERARFRPDFAAAASMVALGSVIGRKIGIRLKQRDDWTEYGNVWGALIGPPSALKSPAMRAAMRPFKTLQASADAAFKAKAEEHAKTLEAFKMRKEAKRKATVTALAKNDKAEVDLGDMAPPEAPIARTYWTSDATAERLGELLAENPCGLLVERDELSSLLVTLEDERNATARGLYLSGWSGNEGYRFDRIMRGTTALPKFALSVVGGIQPGPLTRYVRGAFSGERADGLLQRFQLSVWPDPETFEYVDRWPDGKAKQAAADLFARAPIPERKRIIPATSQRQELQRIVPIICTHYGCPPEEITECLGLALADPENALTSYRLMALEISQSK